ncbi:hypothetical protein F153LOC_08095 [Lelliottia sp. F153]|uniref:RHS repeat-associated core domain-containing protein n=1 Tax=unclassified Lelliottia TaxID=2642424 RepID=UPI000C7EC323|nr:MULTISPECIES: RHS repeat-associated core domain-containing protein [unclassified Lelliottia]PLY45580.1 hypothetical protein F159LOC_11150 [Lelliottia sp. F159]PLY51741.1 hypothetical protein F154LOC_04145 [Lelliottia sp. F154]PLY55103.1 hypothetical protein F153LOC_08095 [Lelliottia sp. F153]
MLYYIRFRYYDCEAGQYISADPIGLAGGLNFYRYMSNSLSWIDPLGLTCCSPNKKTTYEGTIRRDTFRQAKRDAGIPMFQKPTSITRPNLPDGSGNTIFNNNRQPIKTRQFKFNTGKDKPLLIQENSLGHSKAKPGHGAEPHFSV